MNSKRGENKKLQTPQPSVSKTKQNKTDQPPTAKPQTAGTNSEWNKKSGNTVAKPPVANETNKNKTPLPFIGAPPDAYIAGDYTYYLKNLGEYLIRYNVNFKTIDMQPRGFINRTTRCYINATLQALLMCPPFFNLMKNIKPNVELALKTQRKQKSRIPIIENVVKLVDQFNLRDNAGVNLKETPNPGIAFEPHYVYKILPSYMDGGQEDAEEFLSHLLNGINDEMTELIRMCKMNTKSNEARPSKFEWKVVNHDRKLNTRITIMEKTPLTKIFRGNLRTRTFINNYQQNDYIEPFFTLKLDIKKVNSVEDALLMMNAKTILEGATAVAKNSKAESYQNVTIDDLPLVLIMHIVCFEYKEKKVSKIVKNFQYPDKLKIEPTLISKKSKKNTKRSEYKLFAVVCHYGKEVTNGHYYADVFYDKLGKWIRFDDSLVHYVKDDEVFNPKNLVMPYLLYYIRQEPVVQLSVAQGANQ